MDEIRCNFCGSLIQSCDEIYTECGCEKEKEENDTPKT